MSHSRGWPQLLPPPGECPYLPSTGSVWCLACHGPWDCPRSPSPQGGLGHGPVDALPGPLQALEIVVNGQSLSPEPLENPSFNPLREIVIDGAGWAEALPGHSLPMNSSTQHIKDAFGNASEVNASGSPYLTPTRWYQGFHPLPNWVRQFPRSTSTLTLCTHGHPLFRGIVLFYHTG